MVSEARFQDHTCPLFVTWTKRRPGGTEVLRGCIGTLEPKRVRSSLSEYALISALKDRRFEPVSFEELEWLVCTVSLLKDFEEAQHYLDWEIGVHGIILEFVDVSGERYNATYLPEIAEQENWTREECIESLLRKAGFRGRVTTQIKANLKITKYQSTLHTMTYEEFKISCRSFVVS